MVRTRSARRMLGVGAAIAMVGTLAFTPAADAATKKKPTTKAQCTKNGWKRFGFKNQGQCVAYVNAHSTTTKKPTVTTTTAAPMTVASKGTVLFGVLGQSISPSTGAKTLDEGRKMSKAWVDQVNAAGGINGYKVKIAYIDTRADPARLLPAVKDLDSQGVIALAAPQVIMTPSDKYIWDKKIPVVGHTPNLGPQNDEHPMYFGLGSIYSQVYGQVAAARDVGAKFFRSLSCSENPACVSASATFIGAGKREGMKADYQLASAVAVDYTSYCISAKNDGVDFLQGNGIPLASLTRDCARQNYHPTYAQGGSANQAVIDSAKGENVAGNLPEFGVFYNGPEVQRFKQALATTDLIDPTAPAGQESVKTWIGMEMAGAVLKHLESPNPTRAEYLAALYTIKGETLGGQVAPVDYTMQANPVDGSPHSGYDCWTEHLVKDGKYYHMNKNGQIVTKLTFICGTGKQYKTVIPS